MKKPLVIIGIVILAIGVMGSGLILSIFHGYTVSDALVDSNKPDINFGNHPRLAVDSRESLGYITRSYIKFNVNFTSNITVTDGEMSIWYSWLGLKGGHIDQGHVSVHQVLGDWDENTITWNNQPAYSKTELDSFDGTWIWNPIRFNITTLVQDWADGTPNYGVVLVAHDGAYGGFFSKENTTMGGSSLKVTYTIIEDTKQVIIDNDSTDTTDSDGNDTDDDIEGRDVPMWAWALIIAGIALIFIGIIRRR